MGTQEGERNWVDVAKGLLSKCHINLSLRKLTDCNADVFVALYENILGEKVPDYIATPCSQEDDVHNIQSVIDSLSLDYLQISLSHITGENVVRGDKESIKNLLEIFDGLLEYLNDEINEESQNSDELSDALNQDEPVKTEELNDAEVTEVKETNQQESASPSSESTIQSSHRSLHSMNAEEAGSTNDLVGLGVSARTFTSKQEAGPSDPPETSNPGSAPQTDAIQSAVPLQPPVQSHTPHSPDPQPPHQTPTTADLRGPTENSSPVPAQNSNLLAEIITNGISSPATCRSPAESEKSVISQQRLEPEAEEETLEPTNGGPRRVLFRTQPDVLLLTLQEEMTTTSPSPPDTEEDEEDLSYRRRSEDRGAAHRSRTNRTDLRSSRKTREAAEEPLSHRRKKNKQTEEELHHMSEKLAHRLEELDQMLKRVLGESDDFSETREDDQQTSDGIPASQGTPRQHAETIDPDSSQQAGSSSPSPPPPSSFHKRLEDGETLRQTKFRVSDHSRRGESRHRKYNQYLVNGDYEEELRGYVERGELEVHTARLKAQKAEQDYREAILGDVSQMSRPSPPKTKTHQKTHRYSGGQKRLETSRRTSSMKIKENDLLPVLREELPHLHISSHALGRMWEQQMQQVDRLHTLSSSHSRHHSKLFGQLEEAQRKYDLLVELNRKDQDHKKRLREFKDRVQQQKSVQNKLREQRQQIARAKKYHNEYHVQHRARLMKARTKEERMFRQLFEEGLELQKLRLREQRAYARDQRVEHQQRRQDQIESMENYYKDQFSLIAEKLAQEREEIQVRKKAQEKALLKMKQELRSRMEREISNLQKIIIQNDEEDHFQDLEVQRLRNQVHMASFQYNSSFLH
uniref:Centrosomal protein 95kDa n=1 Tax=Iconisemion striatum TaxID=60296 RepID=A0A1A7XSZ5_9TELE